MDASYRIVVGIDLSEYAPLVLEHALELAQLHATPDLHFVTVVGRDTEVDAAKSALVGLVYPALADLTREWRARLHIRIGRPEEELAAIAGELRAHLLVVGRFGTHYRRRSIGKLAGAIMSVSPCPVLVVGLTDQTPDKTPQCRACVDVREASEGETLFCPAHRSDRAIWSPLLDRETSFAGGGPLW